MELLMIAARYIAIALSLALLSSGCTRTYKLKRDAVSAEGAWLSSHGTVSNLGATDKSGFSGRLTPIWESSFGGKPAGPLAIHNGALIYPETKKRLKFLDCLTGRTLGQLKTKGLPQTGVAVQDSLAFYGIGPKRNRLIAVDLMRHKSLWSQEIKDASRGPIIVDDRLIVSSGDGILAALALDDGELLWEYSTEARFEVSASYADGILWQPDDRGELIVLSVTDGTERFRVKLGAPSVGAAAVADKVYVTGVTGQVRALGKSDGALVWQTDLGEPIWTTPAVAHGRVYVGHSGGEIVALDAAGGEIAWRQPLGAVVKASPIAVGPFVVAGTMAGRLVVLDGADGAVVDSAQLEGAIEFSPVTDGRRVFAATQKGKLVCFGENHDQSRDTD